MAEHDGWVWQGRQYHQWFGSGTKPRDAGPAANAIGSLDQRIGALPRVALAGLTTSQRRHPAARFEGDASARLVRAVHAWVGGLHLSPSDFAARYFGAASDAPGIAGLRDAADIIAHARTTAELREAADTLADAMATIGLDHWDRFLKDADERATAAGATGSTVQGAVKAALIRNHVARDDAGDGQVFQVGSARVTGGSGDLVAGLSVRGTPTPQMLEIEQKLSDITEDVKNTVNLTLTKGESARSLGTRLHTMFRAAVELAKARGELPSNVKTERSYANEDDARYGEKGTLRTDVVLTDNQGNVLAVWDYKTGAGSTIRPSRVDAFIRAVRAEDHLRPNIYFKILHVPFYGNRK